MRRLESAIAALTPKLREVFVLVYLQGLSGAEAGAVLGIREGAVWKRLHTARKKVSALIGEER
jgi:RNA polymerase sigma-70 factor (ECF subfamily)